LIEWVSRRTSLSAVRIFYSYLRLIGAMKIYEVTLICVRAILEGRTWYDSWYGSEAHFDSLSYGKHCNKRSSCCFIPWFHCFGYIYCVTSSNEYMGQMFPNKNLIYNNIGNGGGLDDFRIGICRHQSFHFAILRAEHLVVLFKDEWGILVDRYLSAARTLKPCSFELLWRFPHDNIRESMLDTLRAWTMHPSVSFEHWQNRGLAHCRLPPAGKRLPLHVACTAA